MAKFSIIIACCLLALVNVCVARPDKDEFKEKIMGYSKECKAESGASDADIQDMATKKPASTMEGKCLRACFMKRFEMFDASGKFSKQGALEFAKICANGDADKLQKVTGVIEECSKLPEPNNTCEAAEMYKMCFWDKSKNINMDW